MPPRWKEKPIFQDLVIATACQLGDQWTDTNIARWLSQRNGVFTPEMDGSVTHLLCSADEFKKRGPRVKQALKRGRACHIVTVDWLEDSINKKRRLKEKPYLLSSAFKQERAKIRREEKEVKGLEQAERFVNPNLYHVYTDGTHFRYEVTLTRDDGEEEVKGQRYVLYLFESNAEPHLYLFAAKFYKKYRDPQPNFFRPSETAQSFFPAYDRFKLFFRKKTGVEWDERLVTKTKTEDKAAFSYTPPTGGRPVGYVPVCFVPPDPEASSAPADAVSEREGEAPVGYYEHDTEIRDIQDSPFMAAATVTLHGDSFDPADESPLETTGGYLPEM